MGCDFYLCQIVPVNDSELKSDFDKLIQFCSDNQYYDLILDPDWIHPPEPIKKHLIQMQVPYVEHDLIKQKFDIPSSFEVVSESWEDGINIYIFSPPNSDEYREVEVPDDRIDEFIVYHPRSVLIYKELNYLGKFFYGGDDLFKEGKHPFFDEYNFQFFHVSVQSCIDTIFNLVTEIPKHIEESIRKCEGALQKDPLSFIFISA